jgi:solute carrier family 25 carnitine/acylcarnitine transporter 20/29
MADSVADVEAAGGAAQTAKDLFAGAAGGVAQVLLGMFLN